jgi:mRNA-degrading endonuclease toxin of MazEF toxin-antitoxin module
MIQPGEVYMADFGPAGPHPVIVVSREELNRGHYALVVACTSARFAVRSKLSNCVPFRAGEFGFTLDCVAQYENILSIDQAQIDLAVGPLGILDDTALQNVIKAIGYVIKSDCKPLQGAA